MYIQSEDLFLRPKGNRSGPEIRTTVIQGRHSRSAADNINRSN